MALLLSFQYNQSIGDSPLAQEGLSEPLIVVVSPNSIQRQEPPPLQHSIPMTSSHDSLRIAVYPGSFDPITLGHLNVMERASRLFDRLIVGIGVNIEKQTLFSPEERRQMIRDATVHLKNVEIRTFTGLAVGFVKQCGARIILRGVRPITDIAAELTMMMANRRLAPDVETLFMIADGDLAHVSSAD